MGIRRACSYKAVFKTPVAPSNYTKILVTVQQDGINLITKNKSDLTLTSTTATMNLTQAETAQFESGKRAYIQIRCYKAAYDAPGSKVWPVDVWPALDDQILS
jgi:hypothetical protein